MNRNVAGLIAMTIYAGALGKPVYSANTRYGKDGQFDANEVKKARKSKRKKKGGR